MWKQHTNERIGLRHSLDLDVIQRLNSTCLIDPYVFIELQRQGCLEVVTHKFAIRAIDMMLIARSGELSAMPSNASVLRRKHQSRCVRQMEEPLDSFARVRAARS